MENQILMRVLDSTHSIMDHNQDLFPRVLKKTQKNDSEMKLFAGHGFAT